MSCDFFCVLSILGGRAVSIGIRAVLFVMAMGNTNEQERMEKTEQELKRLSSAIEEINKK